MVVPSINSSVAGRMPLPMIVDTAWLACVSLSKTATAVTRARQRHQPQVDLGDDAERALRADEQLHELVAGGVLGDLAAQPHDPPLASTTVSPMT